MSSSWPIWHEPELSRDDVSSLDPYRVGVWAESGEFGLDLFGLDLVRAVSLAEDREWLEFAVMAGYVPHLDNVGLALRAQQLWFLKVIEQYHDGGLEGDPADWVARASHSYRDFIALLEGFIEELAAKLSSFGIEPAREGG